MGCCPWGCKESGVTEHSCQVLLNTPTAVAQIQSLVEKVRSQKSHDTVKGGKKSKEGPESKSLTVADLNCKSNKVHLLVN